MTLLNISNFYSLYATEACNFSCSYCVAHGRKTPAKTIVEGNSARIIAKMSWNQQGRIAPDSALPTAGTNNSTNLKFHAEETA